MLPFYCRFLGWFASDLYRLQGGRVGQKILALLFQVVARGILTCPECWRGWNLQLLQSV